MTLMRAVMPMTEYRAWRALALIDAQVATLIRDGMDASSAERLAWELQTTDEE